MQINPNHSLTHPLMQIRQWLPLNEHCTSDLSCDRLNKTSRGLVTWTDVVPPTYPAASRGYRLLLSPPSHEAKWRSGLLNKERVEKAIVEYHINVYKMNRESINTCFERKI